MQHKRYVDKLGLAVFIYKQNTFLHDLSDSVWSIYVLKRDKGMFSYLQTFQFTY